MWFKLNVLKFSLRYVTGVLSPFCQEFKPLVNVDKSICHPGMFFKGNLYQHICMSYILTIRPLCRQLYHLWLLKVVYRMSTNWTINTHASYALNEMLNFIAMNHQARRYAVDIMTWQSMESGNEWAWHWPRFSIIYNYIYTHGTQAKVIWKVLY